MRYRIKIKTFKNGRKEYEAQVKTFLFWAWLWGNGNSSIIVKDEFGTRDEGLRRIDLHYSGNCRKQTIEFEYIKRV